MTEPRAQTALEHLQVCVLSFYMFFMIEILHELQIFFISFYILQSWILVMTMC